ncbi:MAG: hypothetical protein EBT03_13170 [Betaproteobacteria bacterium]|nr:hypothetical protein [Betaproteobacteria bacterium]
MDNFKIYSARRIRDSEEWYLLCHVPQSVTPWVTWRSNSMTGTERYWGHYFNSEDAARADFAER